MLRERDPNQTTDQERLTRAYRDQRDEQTARLVAAMAEIDRLRGFVQWVADHSNDPAVVREARDHGAE